MKSIQKQLCLFFLLQVSLFEMTHIAHAVEIPLFVQPLSVAYSRFDKHVMLYFEGHPTYEAVEALISETPEEGTSIRIILTRHDQTQVDYFNNERILKRFRADIPLRESYPAAISYSSAIQNRLPVISLDFVTADKENVSFMFIGASEPSAKFGGLTDPEGHAGTTALPVMTRQQSSLADKASSISFDGKKYTIPVHTYIPIFFTGMKGYYSDQFRIGVITNQNIGYSSITLPETLKPGCYWLYNSASGDLRYTINQVSDKRIVLNSEHEELELLRTGDALALYEIRRKAEGHDFDEVMTIRFDPYLPYYGVPWPKTVRFSISVRDTEVAVKGMAIQTTDGFSLIPHAPKWAIKRAVHTVLMPEKKRIMSSIGYIKAF